jgi:hypothetical protein
MIRGVYFMMVMRMLARLIMAVLLVGLIVILIEELNKRRELEVREA